MHFDAFLDKYDLRDPALGDLALIVRGTDTSGLDLAPECWPVLVQKIPWANRQSRTGYAGQHERGSNELFTLSTALAELPIHSTTFRDSFVSGCATAPIPRFLKGSS
jgi:hypothetical protein